MSEASSTSSAPCSLASSPNSSERANAPGGTGTLYGKISLGQHRPLLILGMALEMLEILISGTSRVRSETYLLRDICGQQTLGPVSEEAIHFPAPPFAAFRTSIN